MKSSSQTLLLFWLIIMGGILFQAIPVGGQSGKKNASFILPNDVELLEIKLYTGSCWGSSFETRYVLFGPKGVHIGSSMEQQPHFRDFKWWGLVLNQLQKGWPEALKVKKYSRCDIPNWYCGLSFRYRTRGQKTWSKEVIGCCNSTPEAGLLEKAFRYLKPGGPLGPDRPPLK